MIDAVSKQKGRRTMTTHPLNRREFIGAGVGLTAAGLIPSGATAGEPVSKPGKKSKVVDVTCPDWLVESEEGVEVRPEVVKAVIHEGLKLLTGKKKADAAMKQFVSSKETVALKFNGLSRDFAGVNQAILSALTELLLECGIEKKRILVLEGAGCDVKGYGKPDFTKVKTYTVRNTVRGGKIVKTQTKLTRCVETQADCIIDIPDLKNHGIAGITGALKNLAYAGRSVMHKPNIFHGGMCDPAMAEINNLKPLREKVRLVLTQGFKGVFDRGPSARNPGFHFRHDGMLFSADRVAVDRVHWEIINAARKAKRKRPVRRVPSLETAAKLGLGTNDLAKIDWVKKKLTRKV